MIIMKKSTRNMLIRLLENTSSREYILRLADGDLVKITSLKFGKNLYISNINIIFIFFCASIPVFLFLNTEHTSRDHSFLDFP